MNIDLTPAELAELVRLCEASGMGLEAVATMHHKASACLKNFHATDVQPPEPGPDPRVAAGQWKQPI